MSVQKCHQNIVYLYDYSIQFEIITQRVYWCIKHRIGRSSIITRRSLLVSIPSDKTLFIDCIRTIFNISWPSLVSLGCKYSLSLSPIKFSGSLCIDLDKNFLPQLSSCKMVYDIQEPAQRSFRNMSLVKEKNNLLVEIQYRLF